MQGSRGPTSLCSHSKLRSTHPPPRPAFTLHSHRQHLHTACPTPPHPTLAHMNPPTPPPPNTHTHAHLTLAPLRPPTRLHLRAALQRGAALRGPGLPHRQQGVGVQPQEGACGCGHVECALGGNLECVCNVVGMWYVRLKQGRRGGASCNTKLDLEVGSVSCLRERCAVGGDTDRHSQAGACVQGAGAIGGGRGFAAWQD